MQHTFSSMVIAGGVIKSLSAIGCVRYLEETNRLSLIRNFLGCSAGSIMSLFLTLGFSSKEIEAFLQHNLARPDVSSINIDEMFCLVERLGLNRGKNIEAFVASMLSTKMGGLLDATFLDVAKHTGKNLIVCVTNLTKGKAEYWSVDTVPNMSVIKAIRASCCIPLVFTPVFHNSDIYVDGGLFDNFPIRYFSDSKLGDVIGLNIMNKKTVQDIKENSEGTTSFVEYVSLVFSTIVDKVTATNTTDAPPLSHIVTVTLEDYPWVSVENMQIQLPDDLLQEYIKEGYEKTKQTLLGNLGSP